MKKIFGIITICIAVILGIYAKEQRIYILVPHDITKLSTQMLFCYGREWWFNEDSKVEINNDIIYFSCDKVCHLRTFPEEVDQPPIKITGMHYMIIQFDQKLNQHTVFNSSILTNTFKDVKNIFDGYNYSELRIPLPKEGESIDHFQVNFACNVKCKVGIKSIYLE